MNWPNLKYMLAKTRSITPTLLLIYIVMIIVMTIMNPLYLSIESIKGILAYLTISGILALGLSTVIIGGNLDLSIGSIAGISAILCAKLNVIAGIHIPFYLIIVIAMSAGALIGIINGFLTAYIGLNSIVVTLAIMAIFRGLAYIFATDVTRIYDKFFLSIGRAYLANIIPITLIYYLLLLLIFIVLLKYSRFGRYVYCTGSNREAARDAGIPIKKIQFASFIISGITAAIGGIILASQLGMAHGEFGTGYEFQILTICVLGGISLAGGRGTLAGVLVATLILGSISNGLALIDVPVTWREAIEGFLLILAITIDSIRNSRSARV